MDRPERVDRLIEQAFGDVVAARPQHHGAEVAEGERHTGGIVRRLEDLPSLLEQLRRLVQLAPIGQDLSDVVDRRGLADQVAETTTEILAAAVVVERSTPIAFEVGPRTPRLFQSLACPWRSPASSRRGSARSRAPLSTPVAMSTSVSREWVCPATSRAPDSRADSTARSHQPRGSRIRPCRYRTPALASSSWAISSLAPSSTG